MWVAFHEKGSVWCESLWLDPYLEGSSAQLIGRASARDSERLWHSPRWGLPEAWGGAWTDQSTVQGTIKTHTHTHTHTHTRLSIWLRYTVSAMPGTAAFVPLCWAECELQCEEKWLWMRSEHRDPWSTYWERHAYLTDHHSLATRHLLLQFKIS